MTDQSNLLDTTISSRVPLLYGHLILVGLPGSGKTTIGKKVAKILSCPFLDFDAEIGRRTGKPVSRLFAEEGEAAFRAREVALTSELAGAPPMVLSPGGGWITSPGVVSLIRPPALLFHLRISPEAAMRRVSRSRTVRPLLRTADPQAVMDRLWASRGMLYQQADHEIDVEALDSQRVAEKIVQLARTLTPGLG